MSIQLKPRKCSGTGKAKGHGCGDSHIIFRYGLCKKCFAHWLYNSDAGSEVINKSIIRSKNNNQKQHRKKAREEKESIKSKSNYEKELQKLINTIVRIIDQDEGCISCKHGENNTWTRQKHAGHYFSVGGNPQLRFNLYNIYVQCSICNNWLSGNIKKYRGGIIDRYGKNRLHSIESLIMTYQSINLTIEDIKEAIIKAKKIRKNLLEGATHSRRDINKILNIY